jgi:hypothetical protein
VIAVRERMGWMVWMAWGVCAVQRWILGVLLVSVMIYDE